MCRDQAVQDNKIKCPGCLSKLLLRLLIQGHRISEF